MSFKSRARLLLLLGWFISGALLAQDKAEIFPQLGHSTGIAQITYSPDGKLLVSLGGYQDKTLRLWDTVSGRELRTLSYTASDSFAFSPDGQTVAFISEGPEPGAEKQRATVNLIDLQSGQMLQTLAGQFYPSGLAFSPDGRTLISSGRNASGERNITFWDIVSGQVLRTMIIPKADGRLALSPDGKTIATGAEERGLIKLWDIASGRELLTFKAYPDYVGSFKFSRDSRILATTRREDKTIKLWETATGRELRTLIGHESDVKTVEFSGDGKTLMSNAFDATILWDVATGRRLSTIKSSDSSPSGLLAPSPDGRVFALASSIDKQIALFDIASGQKLRAFGGTVNAVSSVAVSPDGRLLALGRDGGIVLQDARTGLVLRTLKGQYSSARADSLAFSPDGRLLASGDMGSNNTHVWDVASGQKLQDLSQNSLVFSVAFSPDGRLLAGGEFNGNVKIWDTTNWKELHTLHPSDQTWAYLAFSPDSRTLAVADRARKDIKLWDVASGQGLRTLEAGGFIRSLVFSSDGRQLAATGGFFDVALWDLATGRRQMLKGHRGGVRSVAFSPDGRFLASASDDRTVKLWDAASGENLRTLTGHIGPVTSVAFLPDGRTLVSGGADGTARLWDVASAGERVTLAGFNNGEWIAITPEGYYDASSPQAEENLNVRVGNQVFGISAYREKFYRPDLVKLALAGGSLSQLARLDQVKPAPRVELIEVPAATNEPQIKVKVRLSDTGGGIGDVRLFLNGSAVVQERARNLAVQKVPTDGVVQTYTVRLVNGRNELKAVAFNAGNSMQSNPATVEVTASLPAARPSLYAVVVGIQEFKNPRLKLSFPAADARLFAGTLRQFSAPLFQKVDVTLLTTPAETTRESLMQTLQGMRKKGGPEDLFVFFVASHGTAEEGEYFLITSNVGSTSTEKLKTDALSQVDLKELMANIPATKKLIVIDTCNAGALGDALQVAFLTRGMSDSTAMKILGRAVGSTVLSASTSAQEALEGYNGHGLFTYVLSEGLSGKADVDKDGFVSTLELATYVDDQVPTIAEKVYKHAQYPVVSPSGQGFPLVKVR